MAPKIVLKSCAVKTQEGCEVPLGEIGVAVGLRWGMSYRAVGPGFSVNEATTCIKQGVFNHNIENGVY